MRRRKQPTVREEESPTLLLMAAGAVAGAAAGLYLGRRYRSFDAFLADMRDRFGDLRSLWNDDELAAGERGVRIAEMVNHFDDDDEDADEFEDVDEDELEEDEFEDDSPVRLAEDDEAGEADDEDADDLEADDDVNELEEELAAVASANGATAVPRAAAKARQLEERVLDALQDEPLLGSRAIEIAVVGDGVVELTGSVHAIEEVSRASALVRGVPGVSMVLNRIDVRAGGKMDTASVPRDPIKAPGESDGTAPNA